MSAEPNAPQENQYCSDQSNRAHADQAEKVSVQGTRCVDRRLQSGSATTVDDRRHLACWLSIVPMVKLCQMSSCMSKEVSAQRLNIGVCPEFFAGYQLDP